MIDGTETHDGGLFMKLERRKSLMSTQEPLEPGDCVIILHPAVEGERGRVLSVNSDPLAREPYNVLFENLGGFTAALFKRTDLNKVACTPDFPS
jgi:hypothetical protein